MNSEELKVLTEIRNALRYLVRHTLTTKSISADVDYEQFMRSIDEATARIMRCGSAYACDDIKALDA